jgi:hypothetical protein
MLIYQHTTYEDIPGTYQLDVLHLTFTATFFGVKRCLVLRRKRLGVHGDVGTKRTNLLLTRALVSEYLVVFFVPARWRFVSSFLSPFPHSRQINFSSVRLDNRAPKADLTIERQ